ncbi:MAG: hypothetical protein Q8K55_04455 [Gemmatimonadaceae bacterium]|nr:hypothetical protein [Gemmatimonadaceae bacterium]
MTRHTMLAAATLACGAAAGAQETLLPRAGWGVGTALSAWHFSTAIPQASGAVANVVEAAVPFRVLGNIGRWSVDLSGAGAVGAVHFAAGEEGDGDDRAVTIAGPTDVKLRFTGPLLSDALQLTAGLNLPVGKVGLNAEETSALQVLGAPALRMPVAAFGTGAGMTLGIIRAFEGEDWAIAVGASAEQRTEYSPIALALSSGRSETKIAPGAALHITAGLDRALGEGRWALLLVGDVFSKDKVRLPESTDGSSDYTLGPQFTLSSQIDLAAPGWRAAAFGVAARLRSEFTDAAGAKVAGSSGTYLEGSLGGVRGGPSGSGFILGADARWHSGLTFTDALVGAAVTAAGLTIGVERAGTATLTRFTVHGQYGSFDTGTLATTGFGVTLGLSVSARREVR